MPNRILRDWTDSDRVDRLSAEAETLFARLIMKADDQGRFHGTARLIRPLLWPLRESLTDGTVNRWLTELVDGGLITLHKAGAKTVLQILNFGQIVRSKTKFPVPELDGGLQSASNLRAACSAVTNSPNTNTYTHTHSDPHLKSELKEATDPRDVIGDHFGDRPMALHHVPNDGIPVNHDPGLPEVEAALLPFFGGVPARISGEAKTETTRAVAAAGKSRVLEALHWAAENDEGWKAGLASAKTAAGGRGFSKAKESASEKPKAPKLKEHIGGKPIAPRP